MSGDALRSSYTGAEVAVWEVDSLLSEFEFFDFLTVAQWPQTTPTIIPTTRKNIEQITEAVATALSTENVLVLPESRNIQKYTVVCIWLYSNLTMILLWHVVLC